MGTAKLSDTAQLLAWGRLQYPKLSRDPFAQHWLTPGGIAFAEQFTSVVSSYAPYFFSLRSAYVTSVLQRFADAHADCAVLNIGSGLTAYPFLLPRHVTNICVDQAHVLDYYKERVDQLIESGTLPQRGYELYPMDLNDVSAPHSFRRLLTQQSHPQFVLFEGILTYLTHERAFELISICADGLAPGSQVLVHVALNEFLDSVVHKRVAGFFERELALPDFQFTTFAETDLQSLPGLRLV